MLATQLTLAGAAVALLFLLGKSYINHVAKQVADIRSSHKEELDRLTGIQDARLADMRNRAEAWEATATRLQEASVEDRRQVDKLLAVTETTEALVRAIQQQGLARP